MHASSHAISASVSQIFCRAISSSGLASELQPLIRH